MGRRPGSRLLWRFADELVEQDSILSYQQPGSRLPIHLKAAVVGFYEDLREEIFHPTALVERSNQAIASNFNTKGETNMANEHEAHDAQGLVVTEIDKLYDVTEEDLTTVAYACTCTCGLTPEEQSR